MPARSMSLTQSCRLQKASRARAMVRRIWATCTAAVARAIVSLSAASFRAPGDFR